MDRGSPLLLPIFFASLLHVGVFMLFVSFASFGEGESLAEDLSSISVQTKVVSLPRPSAPPPRRAQPQEPRPRPAPEVRPEPQPSISEVPDDTPQLEVEEPQTDASAQDDISYSEDEQEEEASEDDQAIEDSALKETPEQISAAQRNQALAYYGRNKDLVERNFYAGTGAQRERFDGLTTRLRIYLLPNGNLDYAEIEVPSGDQLFDAEALRAVNRIEKFIVPDDIALRERYFTELLMEFRLD